VVERMGVVQREGRVMSGVGDLKIQLDRSDFRLLSKAVKVLGHRREPSATHIQSLESLRSVYKLRSRDSRLGGLAEAATCQDCALDRPLDRKADLIYQWADLSCSRAYN